MRFGSHTSKVDRFASLCMQLNQESNQINIIYIAQNQYHIASVGFNNLQVVCACSDISVLSLLQCQTLSNTCRCMNCTLVPSCPPWWQWLWRTICHISWISFALRLWPGGRTCDKTLWGRPSLVKPTHCGSRQTDRQTDREREVKSRAGSSQVRVN